MLMLTVITKDVSKSDKLTNLELSCVIISREMSVAITSSAIIPVASPMSASNTAMTQASQLNE